jgi:hypothetical protein
MLKLNISIQPICLEYRIQNARLNLQSPRSRVQMETTPPRLEIHQPRGELNIDQTPCRYSIGLKNIADFAWDNTELSRNKAMEGIARIVEEGNRLAQIENKSNAIAEIASSSMFSEHTEIIWAHIDAPIINYQAKPVQFNFIPGKVNYNVQRSAIQGDYLPGDFDILVTQYPSVNISAVDVEV